MLKGHYSKADAHPRRQNGCQSRSKKRYHRRFKTQYFRYMPRMIPLENKTIAFQGADSYLNTF